MPIALTRFKKSITIDRAFGESLANELRSNQFTSGTILLVANEILLDPSYEFNYNNTNFTFPGRYDLILVADRFNSLGLKIDLTGSRGKDGDNGFIGCTPHRDVPNWCLPFKPNGGPGGDGKSGDPGSEGKNFKMFARKVENIEIISSGGQAGEGGNGGKGGDGQLSGFHDVRDGRGGNGGRGGDGGDGGKAGDIEIFFFNKSEGLKITDHLTSKGGIRGGVGDGGEAGIGLPPAAARGQRGVHPGNHGANSRPHVVRVKSLTKLWEKVISELEIPSG